MRSFKHTFLVVITSGGLAVGMLGMAYAGPAGSINSEITISNNHANTVRDTGGIGFELTGVTKRLIGIKAQQGDPNKSETVVQGVRHNGSLPADKITIHDNQANNITNMRGRLTVQGVSVKADTAPAGSMRGEIKIRENHANDVIDTGGVGVGFTGVARWFLGSEGRMGDPNKSETVVQSVRHNGTLPVPNISITGNDAKKITNMGGRLTVQGVSVQ